MRNEAKWKDVSHNFEFKFLIFLNMISTMLRVYVSQTNFVNVFLSEIKMLLIKMSFLIKEIFHSPPYGTMTNEEKYKDRLA